MKTDTSTALSPTLETSDLGRQTRMDTAYNPKRLFAVSRLENRRNIGLEPHALPFHGCDVWNHYEVSWLNPKGKPMVATAEIIYGCDSPNLVESKSLKLYFNSLNQTKFESIASIEQCISRDLAACVQAPVQVTIQSLSTQDVSRMAHSFSGICLDDLDIHCNTYSVQTEFIQTQNTIVSETLHSNLLKSNCLITQQPDWGSVQINYQGPKIDHAGLLRYLISFRNHNEFHEPCIERIFHDLWQQAQPTHLTVHGRYTRRGGLDINPFRSSDPNQRPSSVRLWRQ